MPGSTIILLYSHFYWQRKSQVNMEKERNNEVLKKFMV